MAKKKVDEEKEAKINEAYARKAGVKSMRETPEFKNFGKSSAAKPAAKTEKKPAVKKGSK